MKQLLLIIFVFFVAFIPINKAFANDQFIENNYLEELGEIIEIIGETKDQSLDSFNSNQIIQTVKVKILSGKLKGKVFISNNMLSGNPGYDIILKSGDKVILNIEQESNGKYQVDIANNYRVPSLIILFSLFIFFILIFGRSKGLKALISLGITYFLIFYLLIPGIISGTSPILLTVLTSFIATCASIFIISGLNLKSLSAIIGTVGGVIAAGIIALLTIKIAYLTGTPNEEAITLWTMHNSLDYKGILASSMIIGALGAAMDVGISIASSVYEVKKAVPNASSHYLIKSGMNVGKDIMGTMTNTLLLAYTGSAMFLLLLVYNNISSIKLLNLDSIVSEITAAIAGSIGLILCIPITAFTSGYLFTLKKKALNNNDGQ